MKEESKLPFAMLSQSHNLRVVFHKCAKLLSLFSCILLLLIFAPKTIVSADTFVMGDTSAFAGWADPSLYFLTTSMIWSKYTAAETATINQLHYGEGYNEHPANVKIGIYTASGTLLNSAEYTVYPENSILDFPATEVIQGNEYYIGLKGDRKFLAACTSTTNAGKWAYATVYDTPYSEALGDFIPANMNSSSCSLYITAWQATTNLPPYVIVPYTTPVKAGNTYTTTGRFADSTSTSWTATVDYGDGGGAQPLTLNGNNFTLNHIYTIPGTYTVSVSVTDNQGATRTRTAPLTITSDSFLMGELDSVYLWAGQEYMVWSKYTATETNMINKIRYGNGNNSTSTNVKIGIYTSSGTLLNSDEYLVQAGWNTLDFPATQVIKDTEYYIGLKADQPYAAGCTSNPIEAKVAYWSPYMPYSEPLGDFIPANMNVSNCSMPINAWHVASTPTNQAPVLNAIGNKTIEEGQQLQFTLTATDADGDNLTYSAANLPAGATFNSATATFSWTPGFDQAGNYPDIEFTVTDDGSPIELDTELITITVGAVNRAPVFTPIDPKDLLENQLTTFTVSAADPDGDGITFSATNLPTGATFNAQTGVFSWTPTLSQAGNYVVTFNATDNGTPVEIGYIDVIIAVGDNPTPTEQAEFLVTTIIDYDFPTNVENSYLANLKKIQVFIDNNQIVAARNQLNAFITKVNTDYAAATITQAIRDNLVNLAEALLADLQ